MKDRFIAFQGWRKILSRILNMVSFYGGWLICMHEAVGPTPYVGPLVVAALLIYHLSQTDGFWTDVILIASLSALGTLVDSIYIGIGMISFEGGYSCCPMIAPLWITSLWALYATSINHSLEWLKLHYLFVAAPLGAAGAISSYLVGFELGAATFHYSHVTSLVIIGAVWAMIVPASLAFGDYLKK